MLICQMYLSRELLMQCTETQNAHFRDSQLKSIKVWHLNVITGIILRKNYHYVIIDFLSFPSSFPFLLSFFRASLHESNTNFLGLFIELFAFETS